MTNLSRALRALALPCLLCALSPTMGGCVEDPCAEVPVQLVGAPEDTAGTEAYVEWQDDGYAQYLFHFGWDQGEADAIVELSCSTGHLRSRVVEAVRFVDGAAEPMAGRVEGQVASSAASGNLLLQEQPSTEPVVVLEWSAVDPDRR